MCTGQSPIDVLGAGRWRGQYKHVVIVFNAAVSTSNSTVAQANRYSALPNAERVLGQKGVGKGVVPSHSPNPERFHALTDMNPTETLPGGPP